MRSERRAPPGGRLPQPPAEPEELRSPGPRGRGCGWHVSARGQTQKRPPSEEPASRGRLSDAAGTAPPPRWQTARQPRRPGFQGPRKGRHLPVQCWTRSTRSLWRPTRRCAAGGSARPSCPAPPAAASPRGGARPSSRAGNPRSRTPGVPRPATDTTASCRAHGP